MNDPQSLPTHQLHRTLGATPISESRVRFCVWSPKADEVAICLRKRNELVVMKKQKGGYHIAEVDDVYVGDQYFYQFDGGAPRPDPASRYQPNGVHDASEVVGREFEWTDQNWKGVPKDSLVIYELHIGTFTEAGTFVSAIDRFDELVELGITAIELMPVADAAGRWNWGYDGVCLFAPNRNYGRPDDFRRLVDAAHGKGLAVFLDVVYNHLGPEGNYLGESGPYLSNHHTTPWGAAPNFDDQVHGTELRRFFIANAIHWFDEYHVDGLRVDAVHCMRDESETHVVTEMSEGVRQWSAESNRSSMLIAESNVYDPQMLVSLEEGGIGFDAEWCDDFLHSVFAIVRPGEHLCHRQYRPSTDLDQTLRKGYVYEGTIREERGRQNPETRVETKGLIYSIQHHDFIGNHPLGRRLHQLTSHDTQRAAATLLLLSPGIPMLFMGEEFACEQPFQFFVDFSDESLRTAVVEGRRREYPQHDWTGGVLPTDEAAFTGSKIGSSARGDKSMRDWYKSLIAVRGNWIANGLLGDQQISVDSRLEDGLFTLRYDGETSSALVAVRLTKVPTESTPIDLTSHPFGSGDQLGHLVLDSRSEYSNRYELMPNHAKVFVVL